VLGRKGGEPETGGEDEMPSKSLPCDVMVSSPAMHNNLCDVTLTSHRRGLLLFAPTVSRSLVCKIEHSMFHNGCFHDLMLTTGCQHTRTTIRGEAPIVLFNQYNIR
jgi:hypothetical protein